MVIPTTTTHTQKAKTLPPGFFTLVRRVINQSTGFHHALPSRQAKGVCTVWLVLVVFGVKLKVAYHTTLISSQYHINEHKINFVRQKKDNN